ncbi:MAG TPA: lactonase family protein [Pyrinomonadaceae bacterium]|nr:lactonase family protein [Pyrinomonadaceae bacterium]
MSDNKQFTRRDFLKIGTAGAGILTLASHAKSHNKKRSKEMLLYIGTYTSTGKSQGIYVHKFDTETGKLSPLYTVKDVLEPSFLTVSKDKKHLFAVNELLEYEGKKAGAVSAFAIDHKTGNLQFLNKQNSLGGAPCFITTSENGKFALVANYLGGNVSVYPIEKDGKLGASVELIQHTGSGLNKDRQEAAHAHSITLDRNNRFAFAADLGIDKLMIYAFDDKTGKLKPNENQLFYQTKGGAGPRHFTFHGSGKFAFLINELDLTLTSLAYDETKGTLTEVQTVPTLPPKASTVGASCADIHVSPNGKFLYGSNRGHNSIVSYKIDEKTGKLEYIEHVSTGGKTPRNFAIDPSGNFLLAANQNSDNIVVFRIDEKTGKLTSTGNTAQVPVPVCLKFMSL